mmetsp:Transcript_15508/g.28113  ORF Transcript_15508/g.28113 Transcript_15508/m.28113 type:complete len:155 (-) Transcript_15508:158-622(-)
MSQDHNDIYDSPLFADEASAQTDYSRDFLEELRRTLQDTPIAFKCDPPTPTREGLDSSVKPFDKPSLTQICSQCSQECASLKGLKQHIAKSHGGIKKKALCATCGKRFTHRNALKFHQRQVHEKATRVECPVCFKAVYNKYMLSKHLQTHLPSI